MRLIIVRCTLAVVLYCTAVIAHAQPDAEPELTDTEIRMLIIQDSIAAYPGACACPYSRDSAGRQCGERAAYGKQGGSSPLCFDTDVSDEMVRRYRERLTRQ